MLDASRAAAGAGAVPRHPRDAAALARLAQAPRADLARLNFPPANWVPPAAAPDGSAVLDVLVAGAGMCGQTAACALLREGVTNLRVIDRAARGEEGPGAPMRACSPCAAPST
jgi:hypothetical protein